ncbi:sulfur carrier protein ThiS [Schnuerera sp.]|uniref:sulfur carrier protein ThiS n=1 Tax=Schnuerera sp. TaxID=2794844 RepID=UPI002D17947B|nr:sulfur carrier protein ThiS [Schnuerera sp.]HSH35288.1 sulfur carrier protein ThiS [Schnuerera sp.]
MDIVVNGKTKKVDENITVEELLTIEGYSHWVGVWVNNKQLLQREYPNYIIKEKDIINIVRPLGGG